MASTGIIVRASQSVSSLEKDWIPEALGSRTDVLAAIQRCLPAGDVPLSLTFQVEGPHKNEYPGAISVSGVWGVKESEVIRRLCEFLEARFYDAEAGDFIEP